MAIRRNISNIESKPELKKALGAEIDSGQCYGFVSFKHDGTPDGINKARKSAISLIRSALDEASTFSETDPKLAAVKDGTKAGSAIYRPQQYWLVAHDGAIHAVGPCEVKEQKSTRLAFRPGGGWGAST